VAAPFGRPLTVFKGYSSETRPCCGQVSGQVLVTLCGPPHKAAACGREARGPTIAGIGRVLRSWRSGPSGSAPARGSTAPLGRVSAKCGAAARMRPDGPSVRIAPTIPWDS
jgi:hypothetical protein